ncbi:MAG: hypothetical protein EOO18_07295, partial [Chryseobacterium sp.]
MLKNWLKIAFINYRKNWLSTIVNILGLSVGLCVFLLIFQFCRAQETFPVNGSWDIRPGKYAFTNATIVTGAGQTLSNATLLVNNRLIESVGTKVDVPKGYITVDLKG